MMIREYLSKEEAEKERETLDRLLPKMNMSELEREAIMRMKFWLLQKIDREETDIGFFDFEEFSKTFRMTRTAAYILAGIRYNMPPNGGTFVITRRDIASWAHKQRVKAGMTEYLTRWVSHKNVLSCVRKRKRAFEEIGIRYAVSHDKKIVFVVDSEKFLRAWDYYKDDVLSLLHFKVTEGEPLGTPVQGILKLDAIEGTAVGESTNAAMEEDVEEGVELAEQQSA
jgi:hypothetical protein